MLPWWEIEMNKTDMVGQAGWMLVLLVLMTGKWGLLPAARLWYSPRQGMILGNSFSEIATCQAQSLWMSSVGSFVVPGSCLLLSSVCVWQKMMDKEICHVTVQGMVVLLGMELYLLSIFQAAKAWPPVGFGCNIKLHTVFQLTANHTSPCCLLLLQFFEEENTKWERAFWLRMPYAFALAKIVCEAALGFLWQVCFWQKNEKSNSRVNTVSWWVILFSVLPCFCGC